MFVSVSRRTDIPALFSQWFYNRLSSGEVFVRNPFNSKQISRIALSPDSVECFIFWSKDPLNMMDNLSMLNDYNYYFQFTLTAYGKDIEPGLRDKNEIEKTFAELSRRIGPERIIWRYDPIFFNSFYTKKFHYENFQWLAEKFSGLTETCVISFIDQYKETRRNKNILDLTEISQDDMLETAGVLNQTANRFGISVKSCAEKLDLSPVGVMASSCVDPVLISKITGKDFLTVKKDKLREACGCAKSVDIGAYNTCTHSCAYCYANYNPAAITKNAALCDPSGEMLIRQPTAAEK